LKIFATAGVRRCLFTVGISIVLCVVGRSTLSIHAQPPEPILLKNISTNFDSNPHSFVVVSQTLYFSADDGDHGEELWQSNGLEAGTLMLKDINVGADGSNPGAQTALNGVVFFKAYNPDHGIELWKSDGTTGGTVMVRDILTGTGSSFPNKLQTIGNKLFFQATDGIHGVELWQSDGTVTGTVMVKDIHPTLSSSPNLLTKVNSTLFYFIAEDGTHGLELWKSDGTAAGTTIVKDIRSGVTGSAPTMLVVAGDTLFFVADDGVHGVELWKSDGTANGTMLVKDIQPGANGSNPNKLTFSGGWLFFSADNGSHGTELWKSDGTAAGTTLVKDIMLDSTLGNSSSPSNLIDVNGTLYFNAFESTTGRELWRSDGTEAGTVLVRDIVVGPGSSRPSQLTLANDTLFFSADTNEFGLELWKSNGTATSTVIVGDINPGTSDSEPLNLSKFGNSLVFSADNGSNGRQLWMLSLQNTPPTVTATTPLTGSEGSAVLLQTDPIDVDDDTLAFEWTSNSASCLFSNPTTASPAITCAENGIYTATLTVYDWWNETATATVTVIVDNVAPVVEGSVITVTTPLAVSWLITFTDPGSLDSHSVIVAWGDGVEEVVAVDEGGRSVLAQHSYANSGEYELEVTVMDQDGGTGRHTTTLQLTDPPQNLRLPLLKR
jgi:ELWxxDGT repeat protein